MIMLYIVKFMSSWSGVHALGRGQYYHFAKCPKLQFFPVLYFLKTVGIQDTIFKCAHYQEISNLFSWKRMIFWPC